MKRKDAGYERLCETSFAKVINIYDLLSGQIAYIDTNTHAHLDMLPLALSNRKIKKKNNFFFPLLSSALCILLCVS